MFCDDSRGVDYLHPREGRIVVDLNVLLRQSPYHPVLGKPLLAFTIKLITVLSEHREILQLQQLQDPVKRPFLIIFKQTPYEFAVIDLLICTRRRSLRICVLEMFQQLRKFRKVLGDKVVERRLQRRCNEIEAVFSWLLPHLRKLLYKLSLYSARDFVRKLPTKQSS